MDVEELTLFAVCETKSMMWTKPVRYYASSLSFAGGVLVHDGFDDKVCVEFRDQLWADAPVDLE